MYRDAIIDEHVKFDVRTKQNPKGFYVCIAHNAREKDVAAGATITFFIRNYGTKEEPRFWTPGPAFLNMTDAAFKPFEEVGIKLDARILAGDFDEKVSAGTIGKVILTENGISYSALQSKSNNANTVVYWSIMDLDSPFAGLTSQFTITTSKRGLANQRYVVAKSTIAGIKSFNRVHFARKERMVPILKGTNGEYVDIKQGRWVSIIGGIADAIGYLTEQSLTEAVLLGFNQVMKGE